MTDQSIIKGGGPSPNRAVRVMFAGSQCIGLFADEIESIADWRTPTPLPGAPPGVLGVVCIRGRMSTVLDAAALLGEAGTATPTRIVTLRGDEQVGLAVDRTGDVIESTAAEMKDPEKMNPLLAEVIKKNNQPVLMLDPRQLFATAMRGRERRRRNF
ncbi:MAG: chemotaxis protein CheW [Acidobacteriota bacterium]|nr:chemotaxis protein CheW [Acidobacteriota bacterium]